MNCILRHGYPLVFTFILFSACAKKETINREDLDRVRSQAETAVSQIDAPPSQKEKTDGKEVKPSGSKPAKVMPSSKEKVTGGDVWREGEWIIAYGECAEVNLSREEAIEKATNEARQKAIQKAVGVQVMSSQLMIEDTRLSSFSRYIATASYGKTIDETVSVEQFKSGEDRFGIPVNTYRVKLQCRVIEEKGIPDPGFVITININKMLFKEGDIIQMEVTPSRDCYLTIFNVYEAEDKVIIIFPNEFDENSLCMAGKMRKIPGPESGISLKAFLPEGKSRSSELLWVLATKKPMDFRTGLPKWAKLSYHPTPVSAVNEIQKRLVTIPLNERAQTSEIFTIEK